MFQRSGTQHTVHPQTPHHYTPDPHCSDVDDRERPVFDRKTRQLMVNSTQFQTIQTIHSKQSTQFMGGSSISKQSHVCHILACISYIRGGGTGGNGGGIVLPVQGVSSRLHRLHDPFVLAMPHQGGRTPLASPPKFLGWKMETIHQRERPRRRIQRGGLQTTPL